jgi:predicted phage terminase large subunit-like protein
VYPVPVATDKVTRARPFAAHAEAGLVFTDRSADWWLGAEPQLLGFPTMAHDDVVDAGSIATAMALGQIGQEAAAQPTKVRFAGGRAA